MSNEADHVQVNVTLQPGGSVLPGFGGAIILSHTADWDEHTRTYTSTSGLAEDFDTTSPEYRAGAQLLGQNPRPPSIQVGRMTASVIMKYAMRAAVPAASKVHLVKVKGDGFEDTTISYTSSATNPLRSAVNYAVVNALNAVTDKNYTAAFDALVYADATFVAEADTELMTMANALVYADHTFTAGADDIIHIAAHGLLTGDGPFRLTTTAADLPLNLLTATDYWWITIDAGTGYLAATLADALAGTKVDIADAGTGVHTIADTAETRRVVAHGLYTGDGPFQVSNAGGALPTGLVGATDYYVIRDGVYTFKLATTLALAMAGTAQAISTDGTGVQTISDTVSTVSPDLGFTVTGDNPSDWFSIEAVDSKLFYLAMTHTVSNLADDLIAIFEEDATSYCLIALYPSTDYVLEVAAYCESAGRTFVVDVPETDALNVAAVSGTDTIKQLFDLGYKNTMAAYHHAPNEFFAAAWMGRFLPTTPGKATPKWKNLSGVTVSKINPTQRANLVARRGNAYQLVGSRGSTWEGTVPSTTNKFFDVTRNLHWLTATIQNKGVDLFQGSEIPYTPEGIQDCGGVVEASFELAIQNGVGARIPAPKVTLPTIENIDELLPEDKSNRVIRNILGELSLAGAVHGMIVDVNVSF